MDLRAHGKYSLQIIVLYQNFEAEIQEHTRSSYRSVLSSPAGDTKVKNPDDLSADTMAK